MSSITDTTTIASVLKGLKTLSVDHYIIAFGPGGEQFIGTPNGYSS
jgi:hypothetical protein